MLVPRCTPAALVRIANYGQSERMTYQALSVEAFEELNTWVKDIQFVGDFEILTA